MPSVSERFEGEARGFHAFTNAAVTENQDLDAAAMKRSRDRQLRRNVATTVYDCEENLHRASSATFARSVAAKSASVITSMRSWTSSTDSPRSIRKSFQA